VDLRRESARRLADHDDVVEDGVAHDLVRHEQAVVAPLGNALDSPARIDDVGEAQPRVT